MTLPDFLTQDADGEIRLTGHRIGLYTVVRCVQVGYSAERIAEDFPSLPLALVQQVLAFYRGHQEEVDSYVAGYRADLDRQEAAYVPRPGAMEIRQLMERLEAAGKKYAGEPG